MDFLEITKNKNWDKSEPVLALYGVATNSELSRGVAALEMIKIEPNQIWLECRCISSNIELNTSFEFIVPYYKSIKKYDEHKTKLRYISMKPSRIGSDTCLPCGYSAVCLIEFDTSVASIFLDLKQSIHEQNWLMKNPYYLMSEKLFDQLFID